MRGFVVLFILAAAMAAVGGRVASAAPPSGTTYYDPAGDGTYWDPSSTAGVIPDITDVTVSNTQGAVKWYVHVPNEPNLACSTALIGIDADNNPSTGYPGNGFEYELRIYGGGGLCPPTDPVAVTCEITHVVQASNGAWGFEGDPSATQPGCSWKSKQRVLSVSESRSALSNTTEFGFLVVVGNDYGFDATPFQAWTYTLSLRK